jgi:all-trans-8'-apo-beta-carotenal 15,15'-oxygenase
MFTMFSLITTSTLEPPMNTEPTSPSARVPRAPAAGRGPLFVSAFEGLAREHGFTPLQVEGTLPPSLWGTLYRNGPAVFDAGTSPHWFDGNGALTAVRFDGAGATGAVRLLHSASADHDAGREHNRYAAFGQPMSWPQRLRALFGAASIRNAANVNVLPWQGRLFALYETTPPLEVDPNSLDTIGETTLDGVVDRAWNAHPHRIASRRTTYQFGVRIGATVHLDVYALPDHGDAKRLATVRLPGVSEVHDAFVTEHHIVFVIPPLWASPLRLIRVGAFVEALEWRKEAGCKVIVIPIDRPHEITTFETEGFFWWHALNAFERDGGRTLVLDVVRYPEFPEHDAWLRAVTAGLDRGASTASVWRGVLDLQRRAVRWEERYARPCEFPTVHPAAGGHPYRHAWMAGYARAHDGRGWWDRLVRLDVETGQAVEIDPGPDRAVSEPIVVPRSGAEDDVWVLATVRDLARGATHVGVWDGARPEAEPVARVWFDQLLPPPLHGAWVGAPQ